jgi:hypothetical protein
VRGVEETGHLLRRLALDAHGEAETTDFKVGHAAVEHLAQQVGGRLALQRTRAVFAATDVLDVVADAHVGRLSGKPDDFGLYAGCPWGSGDLQHMAARRVGAHQAPQLGDAGAAVGAAFQPAL